MNTSPLYQILDGLMKRYQERVPDVQLVIDGMIRHHLIDSIDDIQNDHIAFRTMGVPHLGIHSLEKIFLHYGYEKQECYRFEQKKLNAHWYSPPEEQFPRIFISELCVHELSEANQNIIHKYTSEVLADPVNSLDLNDWKSIDEFLHSPLWQTPSWEDYSTLREESEYAAWVIYNRYYLNHFTISVHKLPDPYNSIDRFNDFLESLGLTLNDSGGKIKSSVDGLLRQSSSVARSIQAEFSGQNGRTELHDIAGSYIEFAERKVLPEYANLPPEQITRHHRRNGFEAGNADKIFESTYRSQTEKS